MHLKNVVSTAIILLFLICGIQCEEYGMCHVWGDPHLRMFPESPNLEDYLATYWCQSPGRMVMLKNKYVEVAIHVTQKPFYNEKYEIKIFNEDSVACTINHQNQTCSHALVRTQKLGDTLEIEILNVDTIIITVTALPHHSSNVYNIQILQSYTMIHQSTGLCKTRHPTCRLEQGANLFGTRRKRNVHEKQAKFICDEYVKEGEKLSKPWLGNKKSKMMEHLRTACVDDIGLSDDPIWANSIIGVAALDAMSRFHVKGPQRLQHLKTVIPAIMRAEMVARNNSLLDPYPRTYQ